MTRPPSRRRPHRGFTLVEVVIALSLLSLIMLGLVSALAGFGTAASRLDQHAGRAGDAWQVATLLRATLTQGVGQLRQKLPDGSSVVFFQGAPQEIAWLGNMPARYGAGGLQRFRLSAADTPPRLLLQFQPYDGTDTAIDGNAAASQVLAEALEDFHVAYQARPGTPGDAARWADRWAVADDLPQRVRIDIAAAGRSWPPLFIAIDRVDNSGGVRIVDSDDE